MTPIPATPKPCCPHGDPTICLSSEVQQKLQRQAFGRQLLNDVRRLDLNFREYQMAEIILELSYGWGLECVVIPKLEIFTALTGVAKPHVSTNLAAMIEIGLLAVEKTVVGNCYRIVPNPDSWRCRPKVSRAAMADAITMLKIFNKLDDPAHSTKANEDAQGCPHFFKELFSTKNFKPVVTSSVTVTAEDMLNL